MNDSELLDQIERDSWLTSATSLADVQACRDQLNRRRHQRAAGVAAIAAVAAIAVAVPVVGAGGGGSGAPAAGSSGTAGSTTGRSSAAPGASRAVDIRTASFEVALASPDQVTVTFQRWFDDPAGLQQALAEAGVPVLVRSGAGRGAIVCVRSRAQRRSRSDRPLDPAGHGAG